MICKNGKKKFRLDPRTKLFLILLCVLSSMSAPSLAYQFGLVVLIALLAAGFGKWGYAVKGVIAYALICFFTAWIMQEMTGTLRTMFVAFLGLLHKVYACGMLAGVVLTTTKVSEFLSAMNRLHAPKKLVIPLAVMLRYLPTVGEDWRYIKDAMRMRDVFPSVRGFLTAPGMTVECIYVPFMMAASKAADELSIAAVTRGIENPKPRTCLVQIRLEITDAAAVLLFLGYFAAGLYLGRSRVYDDRDKIRVTGLWSERSGSDNKKGRVSAVVRTQRLWKNNSHASDQRSDPGILSGRDDRGCICGRRACAGYADVSDRRAGRLGFSEPAHTVF